MGIGIFGNNSKEEQSLYQQIQSYIKLDEEHYEVQLSWKDSASLLKDNFRLSMRRLTGLLRRLMQQPRTFEEYDKAMREQIESGIAEVLEDPSVIEREREHSKLRVVYDASVKDGGGLLK